MRSLLNGHRLKHGAHGQEATPAVSVALGRVLVGVAVPVGVAVAPVTVGHAAGMGAVALDAKGTLNWISPNA